jgi:NAD+ synthase
VERIGPDVLALDCNVEIERIAERLRSLIVTDLRRRGAVIAVSGGVDSSVCAALACRALGPERVFALLLPESESSAGSHTLGLEVVHQLGMPYAVENIGPALEAIGCYRHRDEAIRRIFPDFGDGWKSKIVISAMPGGLSFFRLVVQNLEGETKTQRLPAKEYLQIVAATSFKQRIRKTVEYFHADRLNYAVVGTPNRLEYDQGFFVKNGDGSADVKPIAHLYKTQVYALAQHLGLPAAVCSARPTTDTYTLSQGQDEFYFALPYEQMDLALWAHNHRMPSDTLATAIGIAPATAARVYEDIESKRRATAYLHARPLLIDVVSEAGSHP